MAHEIYYIAELARRDADEANGLAATAHSLLKAIHAVRRELARVEAAGDRECTAYRIRDRWSSACESRNHVIRQWQVLTGRQWDDFSDNMTRA